jgi:Spy/CpxP family protein refolding chaperone
MYPPNWSFGMRKLIQASVAMIALMIATGTAMVAQAPQGSDQGGRPHGQFRGHQPDPEMEVKMLTKRLNLTPDQAAQVEPILADSQARMKALKPIPGSQPDFKAMREQRQAIMEDTKSKLSSVLTPEQQTEFAKMREHKGGRGPRGNWKPQPNGSSPTA